MLNPEAESLRGHPVPSQSPLPGEVVAPQTAAPSMWRQSKILLQVLLCALFAPVLFGLGMWLQYEYVSKPTTLKEAGIIEVGRMTTALPPETILPTANANSNGA